MVPMLSTSTSLPPLFQDWFAGRGWAPRPHQLALLDKALGASPFLAGDRLSLADLFLLPMLFYLRMQPEYAALAPRCKAVGGWYDRMAARPSFAATLPQLPKAA